MLGCAACRQRRTSQHLEVHVTGSSFAGRATSTRVAARSRPFAGRRSSRVTETSSLTHHHPMKTTTFQRTTLCYCILSAFGALASVTPSLAQAQDTATSVQRVEITGSSIKRVDAETALPVQTVTREQIETLGVTNTEQLLQN